MIRKDLARLLQRDSISYRAQRAICEAILADIRFNFWFAQDGKKSLSLESALEYLEMYEEICKKAAAVATEFECGRSGVASDVVIASEIEGLTNELRKLTETFPS